MLKSTREKPRILYVLSIGNIGRAIIWIFIYFLLVIILQILGGAYKAEFSAYPDSPAHHVTAIMVSEYLREGMGRSPQKFAEQFYVHYPKVAIGHWPPFYYLCAGIWGLLFGVGHTSYLVFMALLAGLLAALLRAVVSQELGRWEGGAAGALLLMLPPVREGSQAMMLDTMAALLSLLAGCALVMMFEKRSMVGALLFGLLASCAILTKASGIALAMVPLLMAALMRNWKVLKRKVFWLSALLVAVVVGPWTVYFMRSAKNGLSDETSWTYARAAGPGFLWFLIDATGPFLFALVIYGIWLKVIKPFPQRETRAVWAMLFGSMISTYTLLILVPAGIDQRYLMPAFPSLVAFAVAGISGAVNRMREQGWPRAAQVGVAIALLFAGVAAMRRPQRIPSTGFGKVVEYIVGRYATYPKIAILVCSDAIGEGVVTSEFATREPRPGPYIVLRASKQLANSDWVGQDYHVLFNNSESLKEYLESVPMTLILVDRSVDANPTMNHVLQVESILAQGQGIWRIDSEWSLNQPKSGRKIELYAIEPEDYRMPEHISVDMERMLGRQLKNPE